MTSAAAESTKRGLLKVKVSSINKTLRPLRGTRTYISSSAINTHRSYLELRTQNELAIRLKFCTYPPWHYITFMFEAAPNSGSMASVTTQNDAPDGTPKGAIALPLVVFAYRSAALAFCECIVFTSVSSDDAG